MKPHQKVLELAAEFTAQAYKAEDGERTGNNELAMLHRGERDAFHACAQRANDLARNLAEADGWLVSAEPAGGTAPPDAEGERGEYGATLRRLWTFIHEVDDRVTTCFDNLHGHGEYHKLFTREGSPDIFTRLDKLEKHLDSLSGANEMHAGAHGIEQEERRRLERRIESLEGGLDHHVRLSAHTRAEPSPPPRPTRRFGRA